MVAYGLNLLVLQGGDKWEENALRIINYTKFYSMAHPQSTLLSLPDASSFSLFTHFPFPYWTMYLV